MDDFLAMVPVGMEGNASWFPATEMTWGGEPAIRIDTGRQGRALLDSMRILARDLAGRGFSLVVDNVCTADEVAQWRLALDGHLLLVAKVDAPLETLVQREAERGDRMIGLAREQYGRLHEGMEYDLVLDTDANEPEQCARLLLEALEAGKTAEA